MTNLPPYGGALAFVREVLVFYRDQPQFLPRSLELEDCTRVAARAALRHGVPLAALSADIGRLSAETLASDPVAAVAAGRAMARWAAREYHEAAGPDSATAAG